MLIKDVAKRVAIDGIRGRITHVYPFRSIIQPDPDDSEEDDDEQRREFDGPYYDKEWASSVISVKISCTNDEDTDDGTDPKKESSITVFFYNEYASRMQQLIRKNSFLLITGPKQIVFNNPEEGQHPCCLVFSSNNAKLGSGISIKFEITDGTTWRSEVINPENLTTVLSPKQRRESFEVATAIAHGQPVPQLKKRRKTKYQGKYKYSTFIDFQNELNSGLTTELSNVNFVAVVVSFTHPKATRGTHKYMVCYNLIDPTKADPKNPISLNCFANDPSMFPKVKYCGDMIRVHRASAKQWNNQLQITGWADSKRTTFVVVRRKFELSTGLPVIQSEIENNTTDSSSSSGNGSGSRNNSPNLRRQSLDPNGIELGNDDGGASDPHEMTHPGLPKSEFEVTTITGM